MFLACIETALFGENCYLIGADDTDTIVVVDPGRDALATISQVCAEQGRTPVGVVATHGHLDHVADAAAVCRAWDLDCWIAAADRDLLTDPASGLGPELAAVLPALLDQIGDLDPPRVRIYDGPVAFGGLTLTVTPAPGHTPGSVLLGLAAGPTPDEPPVVLCGDVVFAGSIGRTDLPGGDHAVMLETLRTVVSVLAPQTVLLPGHGPQTTVARELHTNPYLSGPTTSDPEDL